MNPSLARALDAIQTERNQVWRETAVRLEHAQAAQNRACCLAAPGASFFEVKGGYAFFMGPGHPLSQALAMGLAEPPTAEDVDRVEAHLRQEGGVPQFEMCPLADPGLFAELARRGYRVQEFQLSWFRPLGSDPIHLDNPPGLSVRRVEDEEAFLRVVMAGFMETEPGAVPREVVQSFLATARAPGTQLWGSFDGNELLGGATLFLHGRTAVLSGAGVPPRHRRRGVQGALIRARLAEASAAGCDLAGSGTAPGSPSQRNMERHGFRVAYPKVVLLAPR